MYYTPPTTPPPWRPAPASPDPRAPSRLAHRSAAPACVCGGGGGWPRRDPSWRGGGGEGDGVEVAPMAVAHLGRLALPRRAACAALRLPGAWERGTVVPGPGPGAAPGSAWDRHGFASGGEEDRPAEEQRQRNFGRLSKDYPRKPEADNPPPIADLLRMAKIAEEGLAKSEHAWEFFRPLFLFSLALLNVVLSCHVCLHRVSARGLLRPGQGSGRLTRGPGWPGVRRTTLPEGYNFVPAWLKKLKVQVACPGKRWALHGTCMLRQVPLSMQDLHHMCQPFQTSSLLDGCSYCWTEMELPEDHRPLH